MMRFSDFVAAKRKGLKAIKGDWKLIAIDGDIVVIHEDNYDKRFLMVDHEFVLGVEKDTEE